MTSAHSKPWYTRAPRGSGYEGVHRRLWHRQRADIAHLRKLLSRRLICGQAKRQREAAHAALVELQDCLRYGPVRKVEVRRLCR